MKVIIHSYGRGVGTSTFFGALQKCFEHILQPDGVANVPFPFPCFLTVDQLTVLKSDAGLVRTSRKTWEKTLEFVNSHQETIKNFGFVFWHSGDEALKISPYYGGDFYSRHESNGTVLHFDIRELGAFPAENMVLPPSYCTLGGVLGWRTKKISVECGESYTPEDNYPPFQAREFLGPPFMFAIQEIGKSFVDLHRYTSTFIRVAAFEEFFRRTLYNFSKYGTDTELGAKLQDSLMTQCGVIPRGEENGRHMVVLPCQSRPR